MLIKINNKPIEVKEDSEETSFSLTYIICSIIGYFCSLYLLDYISYIFFSKHVLPLIHVIGDYILRLF